MVFTIKVVEKARHQYLQKIANSKIVTEKMHVLLQRVEKDIKKLCPKTFDVVQK